MLPSLGPNTDCGAERLDSDTRSGTPGHYREGRHEWACYEGWQSYIGTTERNKGEEGKTFNPAVISGRTIVTYYGMQLIGSSRTDKERESEAWIQ